MQINFTPAHTNPNFRMAIKVEPAEKLKVKDYLSRKIDNIKDTVELNKLIERELTNPVDIYLSTTTVSRSVDEKLRAMVGGYEFISKNPLKTIRKAVKDANKVYDEKLSYEARIKGSDQIISKIINA